jgi:hypothetical protein
VGPARETEPRRATGPIPCGNPLVIARRGAPPGRARLANPGGSVAARGQSHGCCVVRNAGSGGASHLLAPRCRHERDSVSATCPSGRSIYRAGHSEPSIACLRCTSRAANFAMTLRTLGSESRFIHRGQHNHAHFNLCRVRLGKWAKRVACRSCGQFVWRHPRVVVDGVSAEAGRPALHDFALTRFMVASWAAALGPRSLDRSERRSWLLVTAR